MYHKRPRLCAGADDAPPDSDMLLEFGAAARVAVHSAVLADRSTYFRALLAWPTGRDATGDDATAAAAAAGSTGGDASAPCGDDASAAADAEARAPSPSGRRLRAVSLHQADPNAALLALRALYGLPWVSCWDDIVDVYEMLDAWSAADARGRCLEMLRTATVDRAVLSALAWETDPRPLSDELRLRLRELAARQDAPFADAAWERAPAAVAAEFLGRDDLNASEDQVLDAALRWVRAPPERPAADVAAVSRAVRYGALSNVRFASLWTESGVPATMLVDAGRVTSAARDHGFCGMPPVDPALMARCLPRIARRADAAAGAPVWRVACTQPNHRECFRWPMTLEAARQKDVQTTFRTADATVMTRVHINDKGNHEWHVSVSEVKRPLRMEFDWLKVAQWEDGHYEIGRSKSLRMVLDDLPTMLTTDGLCATTFAMHVLDPVPTQ